MERLQSTENEYRRYLQTKPLGFKYDKPVADFTDWLLIKNIFPYDRIFKKHHLLIPAERKAKFTDLPLRTQRRYHEILARLEPYYDRYFVNMPKGRSVPEHWHCHLVVKR